MRDVKSEVAVLTALIDADVRRCFEARLPKHLNARVLRSEFRPGVCCAHQWLTLPEPARTEKCRLCGATCVRDRDGQIVEYTAGEP